MTQTDGLPAIQRDTFFGKRETLYQKQNNNKKTVGVFLCSTLCYSGDLGRHLPPPLPISSERKISCGKFYALKYSVKMRTETKLIHFMRRCYYFLPRYIRPTAYCSNHVLVHGPLCNARSLSMRTISLFAGISYYGVVSEMGQCRQHYCRVCHIQCRRHNIHLH